MFRKVVLVIAATAVCAAIAAAQSKPNFSGTWKLNASKSDFGAFPGPDSRTDKIDQTDSAIKEAVDAVGGPQGDQKYSLNYNLDGSETTNSPAPGIDIHSTAKWDGLSLVVTSKLKFQDQDVTIKAVWTLSDDGKTFTQNAHLESAMGEIDQKIIFDKADGASASASAAAPASAAASKGARPNLTGTWKLNVSKSDFGIMPPPDSQVDVIDHHDPVLVVKVTAEGAQGKQEYTINSTTDGKEVTNQMMGQPVKSTTAWEGSNLITNAKLSIQDNDITIKQTYLLSDDGKTLTVNAHIVAGSMGEMDQKMIYEKQ
jgi:hypothetical protein